MGKTPTDSAAPVSAALPDDELFGAPAFLEDANVSSAFTCTISGRVVTCGMSKGFYRKWVWIGIVLGVAPTAVLLPVQGFGWGNTSGFDLERIGDQAPVPVKILVALFILLGWSLFLRGMFSRRVVVFDFNRDVVRLSKRSIWGAERIQTVQLNAAREIALAKLPAFHLQQGGQTLPRYLVHLCLNDGSDIPIAKTIDGTAALQIKHTLDAASNGPDVSPSGVTSTSGFTSQSDVSADSEMRTPTKFRGTPIVAMAWLAAAGFGVFLFCVNGAGMCHSMIDRRWPTTRAIVQDGRVWHDAQWHESADGQYRTLSALSEIHYAYTVNGIEYTASGIAADRSAGRNATIVAAHPPGSAVQIFYNPSNPGLAVIDPYLDPSTPWLLALGALIVIAYCVWLKHNQPRFRAANAN